MSARTKLFLRWFFIASVCFILIFAAWLVKLDHDISVRIRGGWFKPPLELYSRSEVLTKGLLLPSTTFERWLISANYKKAEGDLRLLQHQYRLRDQQQCAEDLAGGLTEAISGCIELRTPENPYGPARESESYLVAFTPEDGIASVYAGEPYEERVQIQLPPHLYAQFYDGKPILRTLVKIGEVPLQCLQAITAVEDSDFLEHRGVSLGGIGRAIVRNLLSGRYSQGGSTLTQQLVKNYFLTSERTLQRKITEMFMALLLEARVSKDEIFESYLNVIYMGQSGPFQVIGVQAAADYYFGQDLSTLNLNQCALLAAIINNPGRFNPFTHPDRAQARKEHVLTRMVETGMLDAKSGELAKAEALPKKPVVRLSEPAPYFTQAVFRELRDLDIDTEGGRRIFTTLNESAQENAQTLVRAHVERLETQYKTVKKIKATGKDIEASLISVDLNTGGVLSLVGGRRYVKTQFNRVLDGHRQVGSVMKPFVYLAALESRTPEGEPYTPTTIVDDDPLKYKYDGQVWAPQNYDKRFHGEVPLFVALKNSLNVATARLGITVGLNNIIDVARRAGITSPMQPLPSLSLGAFEIRPIELAQSYVSIARMGVKKDLHTVERVEDSTGSVLYEFPDPVEAPFAPMTTGMLVSMMRQTLISGTAKWAKAWGFTKIAAGKTGTTSDTKDAWFVGFTPRILTITWVGYDDNTPTGLTGSSGALPLWADYMKHATLIYPDEDFAWPQGLEPEEVPLPSKSKDNEKGDTETATLMMDQ